MMLLWSIGLLACTSEKAEDTETLEDTGEDTGIVIEEDTYCADLGLSSVEFDPNGSGGDFGEIAPDFTFNTINHGEWNLSENWTGCDNYIFVNFYEPNRYPVDFSSGANIQDFLELAPPNTHLFVLPIPESNEVDLEAQMTDVWSGFVGAFNNMDEDTANWWRDHVHFVLDTAWDADWIGPMNNQYYVQGEFILWSLAIDRRQKVREVGSYCDPSTGWEQCPPIFMAYESIYFNFEEDREQRLEAEASDVTTVSVFEDEPISDPGWAGARTIAEFELPDAATMESFDTLELDMTLNCQGYPAGTQCPAWDYIVNAYLCEVDDASTEEDESETCSKEIGRWITTYWRPGRWVHDATPMLAWLQAGGTRKIAFYSQQLYHVSMDLRFSNRGVGVRPVALEEVFTGGGFGDTYNWGTYHNISETEWTQWTIEEEVDSYARLGSAAENDDRTISVDTVEIAFNDDNGAENLFPVVSHQTEEQYFITEGNTNNTIGADKFQRLEYIFDSVHPETLYACWTATEVETQEEVEADLQHCLVDDPANCFPRANRDDLRGGCNFGPWIQLEAGSSQTDIEGTWIERRGQEYWTVENGSDNARNRNKYSRFDWMIQDERFYFCHTIQDASAEEELGGLLETCPSDNGNTDTVDESQNCYLTVDSRDLERGCNGRAWRLFLEEEITAEPSGQYTEIWHESKLPIEFTPPAGTTKVEIAGVISGHGFGSDTANCAEFCDHQHQFWVDEDDRQTKTHPEAGSLMGCADQVSIGTIPNQSGTWIYGRGGWCPGMEVPVWRADLTDGVDLSGTNTLNYLGLMEGEIYHPVYTTGNFNPRIDMRSYLVYYQ